ncbi:MAG: UbiA family prenyltransferase [Verrucomicrobiaceae bacterium]
MRPWLHLARISNLPTVWTNVTAAWLLAGGVLNDPRLAWLVLAGSLLYTGGMILNDAADVKFDREHRKERPIPSGQVSVIAAWSVGLAMMVLGSALAIGFGASALGTAALVAAILFYDLYHKPWAGSVIVMGSCRTFLYLMVGSVTEPAKDSIPWCDDNQVLLAACTLGFYIVGVSLAARSGGRNWTKWLLWMPLLPFLLGERPAITTHATALAAFVVPVAFAAFVISALIRLKARKVDEAVGLLLAGIVLADGLAIAPEHPALALTFVVLAPLLRLWQRWVAAT